MSPDLAAIVTERLLVIAGDAPQCPYQSWSLQGLVCGRIEGHEPPHLVTPPTKEQK